MRCAESKSRTPDPGPVSYLIICTPLVFMRQLSLACRSPLVFRYLFAIYWTLTSLLTCFDAAMILTEVRQIRYFVLRERCHINFLVSP